MRRRIAFSISFDVTTDDNELNGHMQMQLYNEIQRLVMYGTLLQEGDETSEIHQFSVLEDTSG